MIKRTLSGLVLLAFCVLSLAPLVSAQTPQPTIISGSATADVAVLLEFTLRKVVKMQAGVDTDPFTQGTDVSANPSFGFGQLSKVMDTNPASPTYGQFLYMQGKYFYYVLMIASTSGRRYKISETGSQLTGPGGALLPKESVILVPDYQALDKLGGVAQGVPPTGASLGPATSACLTDSLVYQSETAGSGKLVRAVVSIAGPPAGSSYPFNYSQGYNSTTPVGTKQSFDGTFAGQGGLKWKPVSPDQPSGTYSGTITFSLVLN